MTSSLLCEWLISMLPIMFYCHSVMMKQNTFKSDLTISVAEHGSVVCVLGAWHSNGEREYWRHGRWCSFADLVLETSMWTVMQIHLCSVTLNVAQPDRARPLTIFGVRERLPIAEAQIPAHDPGIFIVPVLVANRAPLAADVDLDSSVVGATAGQTVYNTWKPKWRN